ncbi:IS21-like element helper ATPase IstB [Sphingobacterium sp. UDSM-2020]|uniref:IS21-like element helper ATPase IstB n=2 Tax=unclassified Sphingobacterium TaxID=2609468 RepID=UPI001934DC13|nr:IS21-like element helper ATPase IstB [Sphingobacterium sp. UDSM-2020]QQD12357.1 IS21-like element helper ATPase IstB [Sphingobacterium sp. UDSM-2020]
MEQIKQIKEHAETLRLTNLKKAPEELIHRAKIDKPSYMDFIMEILASEVSYRKSADLERRIRLAKLPKHNDLDSYDFNVSNGLLKAELAQLRELLWLEQNYNLILMGPSGTGKTYLAAGLIHDALIAGYRAYFLSMEELTNILKMKDITVSAMNAYNRLLKAHVLAIDDIMLFPINKVQAVAFFNMINHLHEQASIIITTNKSPKQWAETLEDEVLATALLDRLLYRCEVVKLKGTSYRMDNRQTIFPEKKQENTPEK